MATMRRKMADGARTTGNVPNARASNWHRRAVVTRVRFTRPREPATAPLATCPAPRRNSASFSRSAATISSGALATNFSFDSFLCSRAISSVTLAISFCSRAASAERSIRLPSGRQNGRLADHDLRRAFGHGGLLGDVADPRQPLDRRLVAHQARLRHGVGAEHGKRRDRRRRHVHLGAHRADAGNQVDQPVDLGRGFGVLEVRRRPGRMAEQRRARFCPRPPYAPTAPRS